IDWFGTVRARIGYLWGDGAVLTYVTGGLAYGEVKINGATTVSGMGSVPNVPDFAFSATHAFGHSHVNTGWVVGYGTEGKLATPGWIWKVEGLWMDLGTLDDPDLPVALVNVTGGQIHTHSHFTDGILRAGLNYRFY